MTSADTESSVTNTASFLVVPASRSEWASTRAPAKGQDKLGFLGAIGNPVERTWEICIAEQQLLKPNCQLCCSGLPVAVPLPS